MKLYKTVQDFRAEAYQLTEDTYFQNRLARKGDWIVTVRGQEFLIPEELFPMLFERKYASLEEACCENGVQNNA